MDPWQWVLSTERSKAANWLDHKICKELERENTNFAQILPRPKTGLVAERKHAVDWGTRSMTATFHLSLLTHKRVEFSFRGLNLRSLHPAKLKQPIQQLPKEMEGRIIVAPNHNFRAEATKPLTNLGPRSNCRQDGAHQIFKKTTAVLAELFAQEVAVHFLKGCQKTRPLQKVFFTDWPKTRMIREHVCLPLFNNGQIAAHFHLLQQAIHKPGEFAECQVAVVSPSRM